jgi:predicted small lipoprotein YifL
MQERAWAAACSRPFSSKPAFPQGISEVNLGSFRIVILALLFALTACASGGPPPSPEAQAVAENDVAEAVFRYQFQHNAATIRDTAERYCLALSDERNPDPVFLHRFEAVRPQVVAAGQCARKAAKDLFFRVQKLDWQGDDEVWVRGGYSEGVLGAISESYRVRRKDGRWTVDGARREGNS